MRKIGFIFECGHTGPDVKVCKYLVNLINPDIDFIHIGLDDKKNLASNCGKVARNFLKQGCERVIVIWDLYPAWREKGGKPCMHDDRENIFSSLKTANVSISKVDLVCIHAELESWLLADERVLTEFINEQHPTHKIKRIPKRKAPDNFVNPKKILIKLFNCELGNSKKYTDTIHAEKIIKKVKDLKRLRNSISFKRFEEKIIEEN